VENNIQPRMQPSTIRYVSPDRSTLVYSTLQCRTTVRALLCGWLGVVLCIATGCSDQNVGTVQGTIALKGGEPLIGAMVVARSKGTSKAMKGYTNADGHFELSSEESGSGVPVGEYEVIVVENRGSSMDAQRPPSIALKYLNASTSGLTLTVAPGEDQNVSWTLDGP
jgi:hypothetical protein